MSSMTDAYFFGRIVGAKGFPTGAFCKYWITAGQQWTILEGIESGQTQADRPDKGDRVVWSHPIDIHYEFPGIQGWPKISFEVWQCDGLGRCCLSGYSICDLPMKPGTYEIETDLWRPIGSFTEALTSKYIGGSPCVNNRDVVNTPDFRLRLRTESAGNIKLSISLILGRTNNFQVELT